MTIAHVVGRRAREEYRSPTSWGDSTVECMPLPPTDRRAIEKKLAADIQTARNRHIQARIDMHRLVNDIPENVTTSQSVARLQEIRRAGQTYQCTLSEYNQAVEAYTKFVLDEARPDDS